MSKLESDYVSNLERLFNIDNIIKKEMIDVSPKEIDLASDEGMIEYQDKLLDFLNSCLFYFRELSDILSCDYNITKQKIIGMIDQLNGLSLNRKNLLEFYKNNISDIKATRTHFATDMLSNISPEGLEYASSNLVTINELTNVFHMYMSNLWSKKHNDDLMAQKVNYNDENIYLIGNFNNIAEKLFMDFPVDLDVGEVSILSFNSNRFAITIRNVGHALTLDVEVFGNKCVVKYFIPKVTMKEKVSNLPGLLSMNDEFASGSFQCDLSSLNNTLIGFINQVSLTDIENVVNDRVR